MAIYLVGDIQGCYDSLCVLLDMAAFNPQHDHLYVTGDLVARGPDSLATLRFMQELGEHGHTVLGNHDLHLLAVAKGIMRPKARDKIRAILDAPDREKLLQWLRHQPLLIHNETKNETASGFVITHAGIPPHWTVREAKQSARDVEAILHSDRYLWLLQNMYSDEPSMWSSSLEGIEYYRYTINAFTRMRFLTMSGNLDMACKLSPDKMSDENLVPWFAAKRRETIKETIIFGHWAALGGIFQNNFLGLDTGCVWGGSLTMVRWEDGQKFNLSCPV
ncbi:symmetrical bis(5'-nucleosyl)-tetraphosphatase [Candidatus Enterovibrio altilux]|uniref:Bis(5'-nucleosyl)-tetraphosphatase, symmetrical n=1 Tax=Candidatus Enterovibrio altilux TaxID=1927128 RepID=A0A291B9H5_9GAMM|nr:symmetrical bis(5'-nucleosyl)-tetraphosphatase [Candidatus Enterovibrio luxaltus]ATF09678.1 Bis(5'-nucleosyl)-tetraphosphatase, symmetrical [Candidatus Enterovibrio luxaltus]